MESREIFAAVLRRWFAQNSWPQSITESWAKSCGSPGPWASQISPALHANLDPKSIFFISLGNFNFAVAERNVLSVTNERVRNLLLKGEPLCHDDGVPFDGADFFRLFNGFMDAPTNMLPPPEEHPSAWSCTQDEKELEVVTMHCRQAFAEIGGALMISPIELWAKVKPRMGEYLSDEQLGHCQRMLAGYETLRPDIPGAVKQLGMSRCMLCVALEQAAPEACSSSSAFQACDSYTQKVIHGHGNQASDVAVPQR